MEATRESLNLDEDDCPAGTPDKSVTCGGCGTAFRTPVLATVSISGRTQVYYACPRCMTKVSSFEVPVKEKAEKEHVFAAEESRPTAEQGKTVNCAHFFGYMNKHEKSAPFPDDCLTCSKMLECMLHH